MSDPARIPGLVSESRARTIEAALRARPWLAVEDIAMVLGACVNAAALSLITLWRGGYLIRRAEISRLGKRRHVYALPGTPEPDACPDRLDPSPFVMRADGVTPQPFRRTDGVLVCPAAYADGYEPGCRPGLSLKTIGAG